MEELLKNGSNFLMNVLYKNVPQIIIALIVLWVGLKLIKALDKFLNRLFKKKSIDISLASFIVSILDMTLKVLLTISVLSMVGIEVTSFIAVLGAAGLAVGMALQGTLQNFAGGVIVLLLKPYKVGDFIEQGSFSGVVKSIQIFNTVLSTPDNKIIIIPNTQLATNSLINYSKSENRRADINIGIAYGESIDNARAALIELAKTKSYVLSEEGLAPMVFVAALNDSSVDLQLRVWVKNADYWTAINELNQGAYETFNAKGISIPFPQLDVHLDK